MARSVVAVRVSSGADGRLPAARRRTLDYQEQRIGGGRKAAHDGSNHITGKPATEETKLAAFQWLRQRDGEYRRPAPDIRHLRRYLSRGRQCVPDRGRRTSGRQRTAPWSGPVA